MLMKSLYDGGRDEGEWMESAVWRRRGASDTLKLGRVRGCLFRRMRQRQERRLELP